MTNKVEALTNHLYERCRLERSNSSHVTPVWRFTRVRELTVRPGAEYGGSSTRGWGKTKRANVVKSVLPMLEDIPDDVLFDIMDHIYRKATNPEVPSLKLMKEVFEATTTFSTNVRKEGTHKLSEHHRIALSVTRLATIPPAKSGDDVFAVHR